MEVQATSLTLPVEWSELDKNPHREGCFPRETALVCHISNGSAPPFVSLGETLPSNPPPVSNMISQPPRQLCSRPFVGPLFVLPRGGAALPYSGHFTDGENQGTEWLNNFPEITQRRELAEGPRLHLRVLCIPSDTVTVYSSRGSYDLA